MPSDQKTFKISLKIEILQICLCYNIQRKISFFFFFFFLKRGHNSDHIFNLIDKSTILYTSPGFQPITVSQIRSLHIQFYKVNKRLCLLRASLYTRLIKCLSISSDTAKALASISGRHCASG